MRIRVFAVASPAVACKAYILWFKVVVKEFREEYRGWIYLVLWCCGDLYWQGASESLRLCGSSAARRGKGIVDYAVEKSGCDAIGCIYLLEAIEESVEGFVRVMLFPCFEFSQDVSVAAAAEDRCNGCCMGSWCACVEGSNVVG